MPNKLAGVSAAVLVLLVGWASPAGATNSTTTGEFCYGADGDCLQPDEWPDVCVSGNTGRQSPVDIHDSERARLPALHFAYSQVPLTVETNGHTLEVVYDDSTPDHLRVGDRICQLQQFHFHHTAEHPLGGTVYPMEAQLVHNCGPDDLLVVGVLLHYLDDEPNRRSPSRWRTLRATRTAGSSGTRWRCGVSWWMRATCCRPIAATSLMAAR